MNDRQRLTTEEWEIVLDVCTPEQIQALDFWRRNIGYKRIGMALRIPRDAARGRVDRGLERLRKHQLDHAELANIRGTVYKSGERAR